MWLAFAAFLRYGIFSASLVQPASVELVDTVSLGNTVSTALHNSSFSFKPAGSKAILASTGSFTPDLEGDYIIGNTRRYRAGDFSKMGRLHTPLFYDNFTLLAEGDMVCSQDSHRIAGSWRAFRPCARRTFGNGLSFNADCAVESVITVTPFADSLIFSILDVAFTNRSSTARLALIPKSGNAATVDLDAGMGAVRFSVMTNGVQKILFVTRLPEPVMKGSVLRNVTLHMNINFFRLTLVANDRLHTFSQLRHGIDWRSWGKDCHISLEASGGQVSVQAIRVESVLTDGHFPAVLTPIPNLNGFNSPALGGSHTRMLHLGYLDVTLPPFSADPTGAKDATQALQDAIDYAKENYLVVYLPAGFYTVRDTLMALQTERLDAVDGGNYWEQARYVPNHITGPRHGPRAVIQLPSRTPGFTNQSNPKPVVWLWMQNARMESQPNANCNQIFQSVDIIIGEGNFGAFGIRARGAQMMTVQDVTIHASDALAGLSGGAGSGGAHVDIRVVGGKYGFDGTQAQPGPTITGFTLINQTCAAIAYSGLQTLSAVGIRIERGPGAQLAALVAGCPLPSLSSSHCRLPQDWMSVQPCRPEDSGAVSLIDSIIASAHDEKGPAIDANASVFLKNVYVFGFANIVQMSDGGVLRNADVSGDTSWTRVGLFAHGIPRIVARGPSGEKGATMRSPCYVGGERLPAKDDVRKDIAISGPPSASICSRHLWHGKPAATLPSFQDEHVIVVTDKPFRARGDGIADDWASLTAALSAALHRATSDYSTNATDAIKATTVFLPRGIYRVSKTLEVPAHVSLVGPALHLVSIVPTSVGFDIPEGQPVVRVLAGAKVLSQLSITTWTHYANVTALEWRAGSDSTLLQVHLNRLTECGISGGSPLFVNVASHAVVPACRPDVKMGVPLAQVRGGAGAWYSFYNEDAIGANNKRRLQARTYRHLLIVNSSTGFRCYHCNPEHALSDANAEIRQSSNVTLFGVKSEGVSVVWLIRDSNDVLITGHGGNAAGARSLYQLERSSDVMVANLWSQAVARLNQSMLYDDMRNSFGYALAPDVLTGGLERPVIYWRPAVIERVLV